MLYNSTKGPIEIWSVLYYADPVRHKTLLKVCSFSVPEFTSPQLRILELQRAVKGTPNAIPQWDEIREATGEEVSRYFASHPHLLKKTGCTDPRCGTKEK